MPKWHPSIMFLPYAIYVLLCHFSVFAVPSSLLLKSRQRLKTVYRIILGFFFSVFSPCELYDKKTSTDYNLFSVCQQISITFIRYDALNNYSPYLRTCFFVSMCFLNISKFWDEMYSWFLQKICFFFYKILHNRATRDEYYRVYAVTFANGLCNKNAIC